MADTYNPFDWYWVCSNHPDSVFSSAKPGWISPSDSTYSDWLERGNRPTGGDYLRDGELADVLFKAKLPSDVIAAVEFEDFGEFLSKDERRSIIQAIGVSLTSTATPSVNAVYEVSGQVWQDMRDEALYIQTFGAFPDNASNITWPARDKEVTFSSTDDFMKVTRALADYYARFTRYLNNGGEMPDVGAITIE
jgi:hypothetical protein